MIIEVKYEWFLKLLVIIETNDYESLADVVQSYCRILMIND
jgi:hypothetical protein